jgi:hypothetical protein
MYYGGLVRIPAEISAIPTEEFRGTPQYLLTNHHSIRRYAVQFELLPNALNKTNLPVRLLTYNATKTYERVKVQLHQF